MSFGKMNTPIDLIAVVSSKDDEGFTTYDDKLLASVRAYKEDRHGNESWANRAAFSTASALFRFRKIPGLSVTPSLYIRCGGSRYRIVSVEDVKGRGMYLEVLAEKQEPTVR